MNALNKIGEDKATYMQFYTMKKPFFPLIVTVHSYHQEEYKRWRPSAREGALMHYIGSVIDEHQFYVFGGMSNVVLNEVVELCVNEENGKALWELNTRDVKMLDHHGNESSTTLNLGRGGASQAIFYEKESYESDVMTQSVFYYGNGQVIKFVPDTVEFRAVKQFGRVHEARQHHAAAVFGKYMIVHGGVNNYKKILDEVCCFDLMTHHWKNVRVVRNSINRWLEEGKQKYVNFESDDGPGPQYYHRCTPVFFDQRQESWDEYIYKYDCEDDSEEEITDPLVKLPEVQWQKVDEYIKKEGIYFFGGKSVLGKISNETW